MSHASVTPIFEAGSASGGMWRVGSLQDHRAMNVHLVHTKELVVAMFTLVQ